MAVDDSKALAETHVPSKGPSPESYFVRALPRGTVLGRYLVLDEIGAGGMGVVYAAYDPELHRKIAIKVLRTDDGQAPSESRRKRLLREAQAMAKITHPNVIAVHDVGTVGDQVFIAMDLLEGGTLRDWLGERPRRWREVLEKFRLAGEGLAAAHGAGLLHRDFKPENVLVGRDGRVCVTDFGLVRSTRDEERLVAGVGTPFYMAPEQFLGAPIDERTDEFGFCIALYEGLYGALPFRGDTPEALGREVIRGEIPPAPHGARVPHWLRRTLIRGLSVDPHARYPSMRALLDHLQRVPERLRKLAWAAGAVAAVALVAGAVEVSHARKLACQDAPRRLAGIWDGARKDAVHQSFLHTGRPFAEDAFSGVARALDAYAERWSAMRVETCEASRVGSDASEVVLAARAACLDQRLHGLDAMVRLFAQADGEVVERAVEASRELPALTACAGPAVAPEPREGEEMGNARAALLDARVRLIGGKFADGLKLAQGALSVAERLRSPRLQAEALESIGRLQAALGQYADADVSLENAAWLADGAGDDLTRARALIARVDVAARLTHLTDGEHLAKEAEAVLVRTGPNVPLQVERQLALGRVLRYEGRTQDAEPFFREAVFLEKRENGPEDPAVANALTGLGVVLNELGRFDQAWAANSEALALRQHLFGGGHPATAESLMDVSISLRGLGRTVEAEADGSQALAIDQAAFGPDHPQVATALANLAATEAKAGQASQARDHLLRAIAIREKALGPESQGVATALTDLASLEGEQGQWSDAARDHARALAIREKIYAPDHPLIAESRALLDKARNKSNGLAASTGRLPTR